MTDELFGELISSYSRAQAIADGVLIDATETAREAGFKYPVALTAAVFSECVRVPEGVRGQDVKGRLWDVLWMLRFGMKRQKPDDDPTRVLYSLYVRNHNHERLTRRDLVQLKAICGPGDTPEPVITIMLPDED